MISKLDADLEQSIIHIPGYSILYLYLFKNVDINVESVLFDSTTVGDAKDNGT
jgi:hypothetical protein